jgi:acetyl-CoA synthetase
MRAMDPVWFPPPPDGNSHAERLMQALGAASYEQLYASSVREPARFWEKTVELLGIEWFEPYERVLDLSRGPAWPQWFVGGRLNLVHNAVIRHLNARAAEPAIVWEGEDGDIRELSYAELETAVALAGGALRALGITRGDRVGLLLPMIPETAIALLAVARIGAIAVPCFSGYGADAVAERLLDAGASALISADGFLRRGRAVELGATAERAAERAGAQLVVVERLGLGARSGLRWGDLLASAEPAPIEPMKSMDPFMIMYTSGTTGRPKGTVHYHAGFPLKAAQDLAHLFDLGERDVLTWVTDLGWMMGPWAIIGPLTLGATALLYEGAPDHPGPDRLWSLVERHRVTHLGLSPTLFRALLPHGGDPIRRHDRSSLRCLGSTGEPWSEDHWMALFELVGERQVPIINYTGGTEVAGGILGCTPLRPLKPAQFNTAVPGIAAAVLDGAGDPVVGRVGELAVLAPWPGMTHGFWNDAERYEDAYWRRVPDVWVHGDWAALDEDGHWTLLGRSDDTLKIAGKRIGPTEIESAANAHPSVQESAAIGTPHPVKGETAIVVAVLIPGAEPSAELSEEIADQVAAALGKPMRPSGVVLAPDLPRTRNGKIMRRLVRAAWVGDDTVDSSALENPQALADLRALRAAQTGESPPAMGTQGSSSSSHDKGTV